jgi:hypothetical protein
MNKVSAYMENKVLAALEAYAARTNKSKSMVVNDTVKAALMTPDADKNDGDLRELIECMRDQLTQRDEEQREALRLVQEVLGLFVRTFLNHTPELDASQRAQAAAVGRRRFGRFLGVVQESIETGRSVLEEPTRSPAGQSDSEVIFDEDD